MLTPTIFFNLIQQIINGFRVFTESYVITDGGPMNSTLTYVLYLYRSAFANFHMGYSCALAWILVAPVLDIVIYAEPVKKVFTQGVTAFVANVIIIGILGTLLLVAYSKVGAKPGSLSKED